MRYWVIIGIVVLLVGCTNNLDQNGNETPSSTCSNEFLPVGTEISVDEPVLIFGTGTSWSANIENNGIEVVRSNSRLQAIFEAIEYDIPENIKNFDFTQQEIIIYFLGRTSASPIFCFNGLVELPDGRRALTTGRAPCAECDWGPQYTFYYLIAPMSETETDLYIATNPGDTSIFDVVTSSLGI